jgi:hypothetical protein
MSLSSNNAGGYLDLPASWENFTGYIVMIGDRYRVSIHGEQYSMTKEVLALWKSYVAQNLTFTPDVNAPTLSSFYESLEDRKGIYEVVDEW